MLYLTKTNLILNYAQSLLSVINTLSSICSMYALFDFWDPTETVMIEGREGGHGLNADNTSYAVASRRYTSFKCVRNCWWFVVVPLHVIRGPSSRVVTRVIMRRRIREDVIRRAVILKLPDDHKTVPIGIYHLGAYYRRVRPWGWKQRANEPEAQW